jgi:DNA-binding NtrC family response regulator
MMPDMDGLSLLGALQQEMPRVPVIILTGRASVDTAVSAMRQGAYDYLTKPVDLERLRLLIEKALERARTLDEITILRRRVKDVWGMGRLIGRSAPMQEVHRLIEQAAVTPAPVLIHGETGTGKELVARTLHELSARADGPFVAVNCAAMPETLLESEIFGHERGAFTDARDRREGCFELAHGGTLLLDEVAEMQPGTQAKFLRVLEEGAFRRLGGKAEISVDVRVVAATNRDPVAAMKDGTFREDLYYRLNVVAISIPPLRERREEIPVLVDYFMGRFCRQYNRDALKISQATMRLLQDYSWPGNVRELENMIKRAVVLQTEALVQQEIALRSEKPWAPKPEVGSPPVQAAAPVATSAIPDSEMGLKDIARRAAMAAEKAVIKEVLEKVRWNRAEAARLLKISYKAMLYKIRQVGLDDRPERGSGRK